MLVDVVLTAEIAPATVDRFATLEVVPNVAMSATAAVVPKRPISVAFPAVAVTSELIPETVETCPDIELTLETAAEIPDTVETCAEIPAVVLTEEIDPAVVLTFEIDPATVDIFETLAVVANRSISATADAAPSRPISVDFELVVETSELMPLTVETADEIPETVETAEETPETFETADEIPATVLMLVAFDTALFIFVWSEEVGVPRRQVVFPKS